MPSIISTTVGSTTVGANFQRAAVYFPNASATAANPYSQFATRQLTFAKITGLTAVGTNSGNANSIFSRAIRAAQRVCEVHFAYTSAANTLILAYATDTDNGAGVGNTSNDVTLTEALDAEFTVDGLTSTVTTTLTSVFQTS